MQQLSYTINLFVFPNHDTTVFLSSVFQSKLGSTSIDKWVTDFWLFIRTIQVFIIRRFPILSSILETVSLICHKHEVLFALNNQPYASVRVFWPSKTANNEMLRLNINTKILAVSPLKKDKSVVQVNVPPINKPRSVLSHLRLSDSTCSSERCFYLKTRILQISFTFKKTFHTVSAGWLCVWLEKWRFNVLAHQLAVAEVWWGGHETGQILQNTIGFLAQY